MICAANHRALTMHCLVCQALATETTPACGQCGFALASLDHALGVPPVLKPDVTDMAQEFRRGELARLQTLCARLGRRFPQVRFAIVAARPPSNITLSLYAFWLFNRGGIASAVERGGANRVILFVLNAEQHRAVAMIGYGLEPFVSEAHLAEALAAAQPALQADEPAKAAEAFCLAMADLLEGIAKSAGRVYGLNPVPFTSLQDLESPDEMPALTW